MIKNKETQILLAFIGCLSVSFLFSLVYRVDNQRMILSGNEKDYSIGNDYAWYIDSVSKTAKQDIIEGWVARLGYDIDYANRTVVLIDHQGQLYRVNTVMVIRTSVTDYFKDGHDYNNSGIRAACFFTDLKPKEIYTIGIIVIEKDGSKRLIKTDTTIIG